MKATETTLAIMFDKDSEVDYINMPSISKALYHARGSYAYLILDNFGVMYGSKRLAILDKKMDEQYNNDTNY